MAQMASGAQFIKGSFTVPSDSGSIYTLNFGKSFNKYLIFIEATAESKTQIINSGYSGNRTFGYVGFYPCIEINNTTDEYNTMAQTINPSTGVLSAGGFKGTTMTNSSFTYVAVSLNSAGSFYLLQGLTYNYYIVEIK